MSRQQTKNGQPVVYNASGVTFADGDAGAFNVDSSGNLKALLANISTSPTGQLVTTSPQLLFYDQIDGTTLNSNIWMTSTSTMTVTQASNFINLNAGSSTTSGAYARVTSLKSIGLIDNEVAIVAFSAKVNTIPETNAVMELGLFAATTTSAPTDGCFFRWGSDGTFKAVVNYGGVETLSAAITAPTINVMHSYSIIIAATYVAFVIDYTGPTSLVSPVATIPTPTGQPFPVATARLPMTARVYNSGIPGTAPTMSLGSVIALQAEFQSNKPWGDTLSGMGRGQYNDPLLFTQTGNHANSTDPVSATLSNTAAGYTTLGGRFQFAAPATATTDFALFAYQVPTGFQFYCTGIAISSMNLGAAVATTATVLDWTVGFGASAVSLATADAVGTAWAPRRVDLGLQSFAIGAAIGARDTDIVRLFPTPQVVDAGKFFHVIVEVPLGTATASQVIRGDVTITGYFE